jgi:hypothetical protein
LLPFPSHRRLNESIIAGSSQERRIEDAVDVLFTENFKVWDHSLMLTRLKDKGGCYVFKDKRGTILYVGEGQDLYARICKQHIRGGDYVSKSFHKFIYNIDVYIIDTNLHPKHGAELAFGMRKSLELILIKLLRPYRNMVKLGIFKHKPYVNYLRTFANPYSRPYWPQSEQTMLKLAYGEKFRI